MRKGSNQSEFHRAGLKTLNRYCVKLHPSAQPSTEFYQRGGFGRRAGRLATKTQVSPILILSDDAKEIVRFVGDASGKKDFVASERRLNRLPQNPVITVIGRAFFDVGHSLKDQKSNRRSHLPVMQLGRFIRL